MGIEAALDDWEYRKAYCLVLVWVLIAMGRVEDYFWLGRSYFVDECGTIQFLAAGCELQIGV